MPTFHPNSSGTLLEEPSRQSTRKRSYDEFLPSESRRESPSLSPPRLRFSITPSPSDFSNISHTTPLPPRRFAGDGFDYRRPVMSTDTPQQAARTPTPVPDVIDLTNDSETATTRPPTRLNTRRESVERRLPRSQPSGRRRHDLASHRNQDVRSARDTQTSRGTVIDLEAPNFEDVQAASEPDEPFGVNDDEFLALFQEPPSSPGFEITGERSLRSEPPRRNIAERRPTPYTIEEDQDPPEPPPLPNLLFQNLPHGLASWIARTGTRIGGGDTAGRAERNSGTEGYRAAIRAPYQAAFGQVPGYGGGGGWPVPPHVQIRRHNLVEAFQRPRLNYEAQGFELLGATHSSPPPRSASPYKAPRAAAEGFARKVEEDDIVVCPHCGDELGKGDDDLKQQIWVVKQCGHVYCGECAMHRHIGKSKRMAAQVQGKPEPFKSCVVPGCQKPVTSKTALFQVYL